VKKRRTTRRRRSAARPPLIAREVRDLDALREELERRVDSVAPRWNADPEDVQRSVAKLVLTLVEFLRKLFERQALRRMEAKTLTPEQTEAIGLALMRLEETIQDMAERFDLEPEDLNLDLGPLGRLS
jgi:Gas vesicle protein K